MSKRKFGFEGFGITKKSSFEFETTPAPRRLYLPSPPRKGLADNEDDDDLGNIQYDEDEGERRWSSRNSKARGEESYDVFSAGRDGAMEETSEKNGGGGVKADDGDDEIDPLDAFMEGIHEEVKKAPVNPRPKRDELEDEEDDPMESFVRAHRDAGLSLAAEALHAGYDSDEEVYAAAKAVDNGSLEYDSDDNPVVTLDRRKIEPLALLDHSDIDYEPFTKYFYEESAAISGMSEEDVASYRQSLSIKVSGFDVPRPVKAFEDLGFDAPLMGAIAKQGYENPTPIQCQALPVALSGRDMIGIAKTGSGKTASFVLPMIVHIMDQAELAKGEGPIGIICSPTRELAQQIYSETKKFAKAYGIRVSGVYGGMSKFEQFKELKAGCEIVVATPGRLIDMIKMKAVTMFRGTYLVLDEADRMFDLGFEPQIRSIVGQLRPDRQTLLFSATMPRRVERLAREVLSDPIRVTVGEVGRANEDISQLVAVLTSDADKLPWLLNKLPGMVDDGDTLIFASTKIRVEEVESNLGQKGFKVGALHGDKDQATRMEVLKKFKSGIFHVLVATDVAARGLDIKSIKTVVNYDIAKDMDSHVHRIGRTGRAGDKDGVAHTLITSKEARFAGELLTSLIAAGQNVPMELMDLAMKDGRFRTQREGRRGGGGGGGKGKGRGRGHGGRSGGAGASGGGGGRSVRGVDFGMGIGYFPDAAGKTSAPSSKPKASQPSTYSRISGSSEVPTRGAAVDALKVGMMARFKNSFVAATPGAGPGSGSSSNSFSTAGAPASVPVPSSQGQAYVGAVGSAGKGSGFVSAGALNSGFVSIPDSSNSDGRGSQDGGWPQTAGGTELRSNPSNSWGGVKASGALGGFVAVGSSGGASPRSTHGLHASSMVCERDGRNDAGVSASAQLGHSGSGDRERDRDYDSGRDRERSRWDRDRGGGDRDQRRGRNSHDKDTEVDAGRSRDNSETRDKSRARRRPSGWDR
ncbi:hypothetical protein Mapa_002350 [Marchantia paleacea]|nr:hypothetical protein Mapa_002350 [Marchantia paleacea]